MAALQEAWEGALESVFPYRQQGRGRESTADGGQPRAAHLQWHHRASPRVLIPVFPGTNCEYDTARAFEQAGAVAETLVINNLTPAAVAESTKALVKAIDEQPDHHAARRLLRRRRARRLRRSSSRPSSATPSVTEAVRDLLQQRDGLMLGICNGFQALVKLGLVPYGDIRHMDDELPHAHVQHHRPPSEPPGAHARGLAT